MDKVQKIREEVEKLKLCTMDEHMKFYSDAAESEYNALCNIEHFIDSLQEEPVGVPVDKIVSANIPDKKEEPVSKDLEEEIEEYWKNAPTGTVYFPMWEHFQIIARHFAEWQRTNLWKPADGDDLPEIDREVIVLTQHYPLEGSEYAVYFAHRPNPDGWDGKSLSTGKVEHYTPKTYDKGGWNIPNVVYWLDVEFPKEIEL